MSYKENFSTIDEIIEAAKNGEMFILVDNEDRENEGDLIIAAEKSTPDIINFMIKYGSGIVCLSLSNERIKALKLSKLEQRNTPYIQTSFTTPIEAKEGVTTGVSASDRNTTIKVAISKNSTHEDIVTPGHVFPIEAKHGGVLVRDGHTEASVDIARLANTDPSGVICEIMNSDGTMARMPELIKFAQQYNLKIASINNLINWRIENEKLIKPISEKKVSNYENLSIKVYHSDIFKTNHIILSKRNNLSKPSILEIEIINNDSKVLENIEQNNFKFIETYKESIDKNENYTLIIVTRYKENLKSNQNKNLLEYGIIKQILLNTKTSDFILSKSNDEQKNYLENCGLKIFYKDIS